MSQSIVSVSLSAASATRNASFVSVSAHVASLSIAVAAEARRRGIGRRLMQEAIDWSTRAGVEKLVLSVYPHNEAAIGLYRSFGFVEEGRLARQSRKSYGYEDEILMAAWIGGDG